MSIKQWITALVVLIATACTIPCKADSYTGEKTLGIVVGYNTTNREPVAGAQFTYRFNRLLRIAPAIDYVFRRDGRDALQFDANMHFLFPVDHGRANIFPLVGVNYSSWNFHPVAIGNITDDVSTRLSNIGLNLGGGADINLTGSLKLSLTAHYTFIKDGKGANILAGIHYRF